MAAAAGVRCRRRARSCEDREKQRSASANGRQAGEEGAGRLRKREGTRVARAANLRMRKEGRRRAVRGRGGVAAGCASSLGWRVRCGARVSLSSRAKSKAEPVNGESWRGLTTEGSDEIESSECLCI